MTQLFPDMPLPGSDNNGTRDETSGVMAGLNDSLIHLLRNFDPGPEGVCLVDQKLQLVLPVPEWSRWAFTIAGAVASMAAALDTPVIFQTVPGDERWWLEYVRLARASGDNTAGQIRVNSAPAYGQGDLATPIIVITTPVATIFWPDQGGIQTVTDRFDMPYDGFLLEPGASIAITPDGAGVAATVFNYEVSIKKTKIIRAIVP